jgi:hypothetical protein
MAGLPDDLDQLVGGTPGAWARYVQEVSHRKFREFCDDSAKETPSPQRDEDK